MNGLDSMTDIKTLGVTHQLSHCELTRLDIDDDHYYYIDGEFAVSLTRILDIGAPFPEGLRQWIRNTDADESLEYMNMTRDRGSKLHAALEALMNGLELDLANYTTKYEKDALVTFTRVIRFLMPSRFRTELVVADKERRVGGTMDFVAYAQQVRLEMLLEPTKYLDIVDDELVVKPKYLDMLEDDTLIKFVMDYKFTGRSTYNHKVQVSKYREMYNHSYAKESPALLAFTWRYSPKHKHHFDMQKAELSGKSFDRIYDTAIEYMGGFPEPPTLTSYPEKITLFERIDYELTQGTNKSDEFQKRPNTLEQKYEGYTPESKERIQKGDNSEEQGSV